MTHARRIAVASLALVSLACSPPPVNGDGGSDAAPSSDATPGDSAANDAAPTEAVTIRFAARVGAQPFSCSQTFAMMGMNNSTWTPKDFRFYVHDVRLVTASGEVPVSIDTIGAFQGQGVALLDFEDRSGACAEGTTDTNTQIIGRVPAGMTSDIRGLKFKLGVPFAINHQEPSSAPAPLNLSAMWWTWNAGYKFLKIDGNTAGLPMGFNIHVGSTGCAGNNTGAVNPCMAPNVAEVSLDGFAPNTHTVVADLAALVSMSNLEVNTAMSAPGCMGAATDPECAPIFGALGLPFASTPAGTQRFFRAEMNR
ncbi:MAG: metallo-mystery pair system four-Cys motif protein [Polyangiales bacterium]